MVISKTTPSGRKLGIQGEDAQGVASGFYFLRNANLGTDTKLDGKVSTIGGGNVAIKSARTAVRVSSSNVDMFRLESRKDMPALQEETDEAHSEDITINNSRGPKQIIAEEEKTTGVEFKKCLSVFDENKRFCLTFDGNDTKFVNADYVLISAGRGIDWGNLLAGSKAEIKPNKTSLRIPRWVRQPTRISSLAKILVLVRS